MALQFFGTDGIRARVGEFPMIPEFLVKLGMAAGEILREHNDQARVVIGRDTRRSGPMIESALEAGLSAMGVDVYLLGEMPTPGVAYLTRAFHAEAGIVISASHNPHYDNGIKFFGSDGAKLSDALELAIENKLKNLLEQQVNLSACRTVASEKMGKINNIKDAGGRYIEFCKASTPYFFSLRSLKIILDCAHGATAKIAPQVFQELGAEVVSIGVDPDGLNINAEFGSTAPWNLQKKVMSERADLGIAFDGDGDRVIMVDHEGVLVDGDEIVFLLAKDSKRAGRIKSGGVVGTLMSNLGLEKALEQEGIPFVRTKVGDRHVMAELKSRQWLLGGESSGHIIWLDSTTTGDGIVAALQVLTVMKKQDLSLRACLSGMTKMPQVLINLKLKEKLSPESLKIFEQKALEKEKNLSYMGRILLRPSGTEALLRIMVEGEDLKQVKETAEHLAAEISANLEQLEKLEKLENKKTGAVI